MEILQSAFDKAIESIVSNLSAEDAVNLQKDPGRFSAALEHVIQDATLKIFASVQARALEIVANNREVQVQFARRLHSVWGQMLDLYDVALGVACELAESALEAQDRSRIRVQVLGALHPDVVELPARSPSFCVQVLPMVRMPDGGAPMKSRSSCS